MSLQLGSVKACHPAAFSFFERDKSLYNPLQLVLYVSETDKLSHVGSSLLHLDCCRWDESVYQRRHKLQASDWFSSYSTAETSFAKFTSNVSCRSKHRYPLTTGWTSMLDLLFCAIQHSHHIITSHSASYPVTAYSRRPTTVYPPLDFLQLRLCPTRQPPHGCSHLS